MNHLRQSLVLVASPVHLVGALAQPPRPQHRLAPGLPARVAGCGARAVSCVVQADVGTSDHAPVVMTTA